MKNIKTLGLFLILFISNFTIAQDAVCDDFDIAPWPTETTGYSEGDLVGYSQDGTQPITVGIASSCGFGPSDAGIYVWNLLNFAFDGDSQIATFEIYGWIGQYDAMGFTVNGSTVHYMDETFPMTIDGVTIDIDDSAEDFETWDVAYLIFSGELDAIDIVGFESGITTLCVEPIFETDECDDFTDLELYPAISFTGEMLIGYSQGGTQEINSVDPDSFYAVNDTDEGIYGDGAVDFIFDGSNQTARFLVYGFDYQFDEMGFSVNGSATTYLDGVFPMIISGVEVDLDLSPPNEEPWEYFYLTFTGNIDVIQHELFESGVTELCVEPLLVEGCDDLTDPLVCPEATYSGEGLEGTIIGYTQGGTQTITLGEHSEVGIYCWVSSLGIFTGGSTIDFAFDGSSQSARFHIGESYMGPSTGRSFSVNGSSYTSLHGTYPMVIDGVTIDMDTTTVPDLIFSYVDVYLTFTGDLDVVSIRADEGHESNIIELCVEAIFEEGDCDDFTDLELYPAMSWVGDDILEDDILGTTQGGLYDITFGADGGGQCHINDYDEYEGIFAWDTRLNFAFSGDNETARFKIYYWDGAEEIVGFSVNGSADFFLDDIFPMTVDGVVIDLDTSPDDIYGDWNCAYVTFDGVLTQVSHLPFETGILELCVGPLIDPCDDFTDIVEFPVVPWVTIDVDDIGDVIGTTQGDTQPITIGDIGDGWYMINDGDDVGLYGGCELDFAFDGSDQSARFLVYGSIEDGTTVGFSVNGSIFITYDETFPMVVDGISIDIDLSPDDFGSWETFYLTLTGEINVVSHLLFESGIQELCVGPPEDIEVDVPCDDFTSEPWPMDEIFEPGEVIGYTFDGTFPVTVGDAGSVYVNTDPVYFPGLFINNAPLIFEFDGSDQMVQFEIYEWFGAGSEGFELNGEPLTTFDDTYPMTIDGVVVDIEFSGLSVGTAELAHITFSGVLNEIVMVGGELGITGICYESDTTILVGAGLDESKTQFISIYPNPADEFVMVSSTDPIQAIQIYTIAGGLVYSMPNINKKQVTLDTRELEQGLYLVEMFLSDGTRVIEKVILK
ncbi:MAG: hypothetical protein ACI8ZM_000884 [Crocinitomix sp.]|jgi:hypothetical protein